MRSERSLENELKALSPEEIKKSRDTDNLNDSIGYMNIQKPVKDGALVFRANNRLPKPPC